MGQTDSLSPPIGCKPNDKADSIRDSLQISADVSKLDGQMPVKSTGVVSGEVVK